MTKARDYGKVSFYLNGRKAELTFDGYNPSVIHTVASIGKVKLNAGDNTLIIRIIGKNEKATNYMVGVDKLTFKYIGE